MDHRSERHSMDSGVQSKMSAGMLLLGEILFLLIMAGPMLHAQTFTVLHNFNGYPDGGQPIDLTTDAAGNLYGPALCCGRVYGTVYEMRRMGTSWVFDSLYVFNSEDDGVSPQDGVVFGSDGLLYGTTHNGGTNNNGTVFRLKPPAGPCRGLVCHWTKSVLYNFGYGNQAAGPVGDLTFDAAGNIYGVALDSVYELMPSGGGWVETLLSSFGTSDPTGGVILDSSHNLYGTTIYGGQQNIGTIYQLVQANGGWVQNVLYSFSGQSDGDQPRGRLISDQAGNYYGTTSNAGVGHGGTVFELTNANGKWNLTTLYSFVGKPLCGPAAGLTMDAAGSLYGTTLCDGAYGDGSVFKLRRSGDTWTYATLHDFCRDCSDGYNPIGRLVVDAAGDVYGTTRLGGRFLNGVLWEITP